ncbi:ABC transporter ATP-binding protein [Lederbergia galactosidilytica]|uniref:Multidrug ABC transporter ATP-binding protein n=1 Tax=Lederbergia galactosidilytica TaxID=217031 RepID=A0A177ZHV3_9BACI|nr:ABC transporter ATP-binding protein [Lederbergia galactosidilytica]KRG16520.1 multidrug ABC transporter ATP-binding protein [Virgibacillus soli]MBP1914146.1 ABC-2 type transport system ATP-binding protein [Lederbergia galactosidilytica]OAK67395.1 multidrug ABC transporter ATP-binding protein [Lederbergia galactosidilytica]
MLTVHQLRKKYKNQMAIEGLSFTIANNQCVALLGPNGSGKTTTLNMLAGLLRPTAGTIQFLGKPEINRFELGYLPQYPAFPPWMTATEYLDFAGKLSGLSTNKRKQNSEEMLAFVGLEEVKNKRIGGFSGGMKQRLGLAQAMVHEPKLLILDEPVSALDPEGRRDVLKIMQELKKSMAILFSTHVLHDAEQVCDQIVMLKDGRMKWTGSLVDLRNIQQTDTFALEVSENLTNWLPSKSYLQNIHFLSPNAAEFTFNHDKGRDLLLADCLKDQFTIIRFEQKSYSLEEAYMEVVNQ